jgi:hypothetical protein
MFDVPGHQPKTVFVQVNRLPTRKPTDVDPIPACQKHRYSQTNTRLKWVNQYSFDAGQIENDPKIISRLVLIRKIKRWIEPTEVDKNHRFGPLNLAWRKKISGCPKKETIKERR